MMGQKTTMKEKVNSTVFTRYMGHSIKCENPMRCPESLVPLNLCASCGMESFEQIMKRTKPITGPS